MPLPIEQPTIEAPLRIVLDWLLNKSKASEADVAVFNQLINEACFEAGYEDVETAYVTLQSSHEASCTVTARTAAKLVDETLKYLKDPPTWAGPSAQEPT